jgi:uncharacterized protein
MARGETPPGDRAPLRRTPTTAVRVELHVRPGASSTRVGGRHDGALVVRVAVPPEDGKATAAALAALADALSLPRRAVTLVHGATARRKVVEVELPDGDELALARRLDVLGSAGSGGHG